MYICIELDLQVGSAKAPHSQDFPRQAGTGRAYGRLERCRLHLAELPKSKSCPMGPSFPELPKVLN